MTMFDPNFGFNPDDVEPWKAVTEEWGSTGCTVVADRHLPNGVRQHVLDRIPFRDSDLEWTVIANCIVINQCFYDPFSISQFSVVDLMSGIVVHPNGEEKYGSVVINGPFKGKIVKTWTEDGRVKEFW